MELKKRFTPSPLIKMKQKERLLEFLTKRKERKIIVVHGKRGAGKSTLIRNFLSRLGITYYWYRVSPDDGNSELFISNLYTGIRMLSGEEEKNDPDNSINGLNRLLHLLSSPQFANSFIILDDIHRMDALSPGLQTAKTLIDNLPAAVHAVIISSKQHIFDLSRYRLEKELVEIGDKELSWSRGELKDFLQEMYNLKLDVSLLERTFFVTQGWITGIVYIFEYLSRFSENEQQEYLRTLLDSRYLNSIDDFFREEILESLTPEFSHLLISTALFHDVSPELLDRLSSGEGTILLKRMKEAYLFVEDENEDTGSFCFHPLFASFLERMFKELPKAEQRNIYKIAADYYFERGDFARAVDHFYKAGEVERGKEIFLQNAEEMLNNGNYEAIETMLHNFTKQEIVKNQALSYYDGLVLNLTDPFSSRQNLFELLSYFRENKEPQREARIYIELLTNYFFYQESMESVAELTSMTGEFLNRAGASLTPEKREILTALIALGKWWTNPEKEKAFEIALRAEEASYKFKNREAFLCSRLVLAKIYINMGEFSDALKLLLKTEKIFEKDTGYHPSLALIRFFLGDTYFYLGELDNAIRETEAALAEVSKKFAFTSYLELNLITYMLYTENSEKAEALFESHRNREIGENPYLQYFWIYLLQMLIAYRSNNARRASYYCKRLMGKENETLLMSDYPFSYSALGEINIFIKDSKNAEKFLNQLLTETAIKSYPYPAATAAALLGYLHHTQGKEKQAKSLFERMEQTIKEHHYKNLDICSPELLKSIAAAWPSPVFKTFPRLAGKTGIAAEGGGQTSTDITFLTLGTFKIFIKGQEMDQSLLARQKRVVELLKLLIVFREQGISKEVVYETFWPRYSYKSARDNLNTVVYRLRKTFGKEADFISTDMNFVSLKPGTFLTDVDTFNQYIERGKTAESQQEIENALHFYEEAARLYKGDFLESKLYLDYIRDEREILKNRYKQLLFSLTKLSLDSQNFPASLEWARSLISYDSLCEPAYRLLMIASVFTENRSELTRIFSKLTDILKDNYNLSPDEKTVRLKDQLLSGKIPRPELWRNEVIV